MDRYKSYIEHEALETIQRSFVMLTCTNVKRKNRIMLEPSKTARCGKRHAVLRGAFCAHSSNSRIFWKCKPSEFLLAVHLAEGVRDGSLPHWGTQSTMTASTSAAWYLEDSTKEDICVYITLLDPVEKDPASTCKA